MRKATLTYMATGKKKFWKKASGIHQEAIQELMTSSDLAAQQPSWIYAAMSLRASVIKKIKVWKRTRMKLMRETKIIASSSDYWNSFSLVTIEESQPELTI